MQHIVCLKQLVDPWIPLKSFLGKTCPHHQLWRGLTIWGKTLIISDNKILDVVIGLHGSPCFQIFGFCPPFQLAPDSWLLPIINLPQIFYSCLILDSPLSIHAQFFVCTFGILNFHANSFLHPWDPWFLICPS